MYDYYPGLLAQGRGEGRLIRRRRWQEKVRVRREALRQQRAADKAAVRVSVQPVVKCQIGCSTLCLTCLHDDLSQHECMRAVCSWEQPSDLCALRRQLQHSA